jgi:chromosome segregation ATPase
MTGQQPPKPDHTPSLTLSPAAAMAAGIAQTVGQILAHAPHAADRRHEDADEIRAIAEAMIRLLIGVPLRSDGQLTIKALAEEAGLRRNKLTHKHTGLKDLFYALVQAQQSTPRIAHDLSAERNELKARLRSVTAERDRLKSEVEQFARIVHVLEVENDEIRQQASHPTAQIHFLTRGRDQP